MGLEMDQALRTLKLCATTLNPPRSGDEARALNLANAALKEAGHEPVEIRKQPFTVIFYIDADRSIETFVKEVMATDATEAWDKAIRKARKDGGSSSGYSISGSEWEHATEIITLRGHNLCAYSSKGR